MHMSWSSYDRTWFSGPDKQEILIHMVAVFIRQEDLPDLPGQFSPEALLAQDFGKTSPCTLLSKASELGLVLANPSGLELVLFY
jgi:hypothetical protein